MMLKFAIGVQSAYCGIRIAAIADVARCADRYVQQIVGAKADEFPAVGAICGEIVVDDFGLRRIVDLCFDIAVAQDAVDFGYVQVAIFNGDAVGVVQAAGEDDDVLCLVVAVFVAQCVHATAGAGADKQGSAWAEAHRARTRYPFGVYANVESFR